VRLSHPEARRRARIRSTWTAGRGENLRNEYNRDLLRLIAGHRSIGFAMLGDVLEPQEHSPDCRSRAHRSRRHPGYRGVPARRRLCSVTKNSRWQERSRLASTEWWFCQLPFARAASAPSTLLSLVVWMIVSTGFLASGRQT